MAIAMLLAWVGLGLVVGVASKWIAPQRTNAWVVGGLAFAIVGGLVGNLLFSGNVFAMQPIGAVGAGCGSLFVVGYALLLRSQVVQRARDVDGVHADRPIEAATKPIVKHEPSPPSY